jgi:hypothetical protein
VLCLYVSCTCMRLMCSCDSCSRFSWNVLGSCVQAVADDKACIVALLLTTPYMSSALLAHLP